MIRCHPFLARMRREGQLIGFLRSYIAGTMQNHDQFEGGALWQIGMSTVMVMSWRIPMN